MKLTYFKLILLIFSSSLTWGQEVFEREHLVHIRSKNRLIQEKKTLKDLTDEKCFEGKYFKIVRQTDKQAICLEQDPELVFKAANVYYHLTLAREFYQNLQIPNSNLDRKITIRIEQDRQYSETLQFRGEMFSQANGALTIGPSEDHIAHDHYSWNEEIWFFVKKRVTRANPLRQAARVVNQREFKNAISGNLLLYDFVKVINSWTSGQLNAYRLEFHLYSMLFTVAAVELMPRVISLFGLFPQVYFEDTAMIPEVIYHEYGHIALDHVFGHKMSSHLSEGYPNLFAGMIAQRDRLAGNNRGVARGTQAKRANARGLYSLTEEFVQNAAFGSFTYALLTDIQENLGEEGLPILIAALKHLSHQSNLKKDFPRAILRAADEISQNPRAAKLRINQSLKKRGL